MTLLGNSTTIPYIFARRVSGIQLLPTEHSGWFTSGHAGTSVAPDCLHTSHGPDSEEQCPLRDFCRRMIGFAI